LQKRACLIACALAFTQLGCNGRVLATKSTQLHLTSLHCPNNARMPRNYTCRGENISPVLAWGAPPAATRSFVLTFDSSHLWMGSFSHWTVYNLPSDLRELRERMPHRALLANGARQARNDLGHIGYFGPCPDLWATRRYVFTLYALDTQLDIPIGADHKQVEAAIQGHVLAKDSLSVQYGR
jgi:Raf kinase inhibitor-like YbhB/YbcL family protein